MRQSVPASDSSKGTSSSTVRLQRHQGWIRVKLEHPKSVVGQRPRIRAPHRGLHEVFTLPREFLESLLAARGRDDCITIFVRRRRSVEDVRRKRTKPRLPSRCGLAARPRAARGPASPNRPSRPNPRVPVAHVVAQFSAAIPGMRFKSPSFDEVAHDSGIQKIAPHSIIPSIRRSRSAAFAMSNSFCIFRSASQAASSSGVITMGSKL